MQALIINIMNKFGYLGIMFLIAIENIFPPIPSEVILTFGGFMTKRPNSEINVLGVIIFATIGSLIGAILLYYVGKLLNKERLTTIISGKIGKILRLKPKDIEKADVWFNNKGNKTVFFCRFIPIVRSLISIPAGMSAMPIQKFLLYTILGSVGWNTILVVSGSIVGEKWESIVTIFDNYTKVVVILLVILFIITITLFYNKRKIKK